MNFLNTLSNLDPQLVFYVVLVVWVVLAAIQWRKQLKLTVVLFVVAIALTILWFEGLPGERSARITETALGLLKIVISWPVVVLVLLLVFRGQIGEFLRQMIQIIANAKTAEVGIGDFRARIERVESAASLGAVPAPAEESIGTEIVKMIEARAPAIPMPVPSGIADVFFQDEGVPNQAEISVSAGFVIDRRGYVVAFGPDLRDDQQVFVRLSGETRILSGVVIRRSADELLALVELPQGDYPHLERSQADYPELGELVYKYNTRSGVAGGHVTGVAGTARLAGMAAPVRGVITVEPSLTRQGMGEGGSPVLNGTGQVIGVVFAGGAEPSTSLLVSASRILEEFS